jgi:hypothetical protein
MTDEKPVVLAPHSRPQPLHPWPSAQARGAADQNDGDVAGAGEDPAAEGPLMPRIDPLFGLLIGVLAVWVLIAPLALVSS